MTDFNPHGPTDESAPEPSGKTKLKRVASRAGKLLGSIVSAAAASYEAMTPLPDPHSPTSNHRPNGLGFGPAAATDGEAGDPGIKPTAEPGTAGDGDKEKPFWTREPDEPLRPHFFQPRVEMIGERLPKVLITPTAYKHMCLYVDIASKEVGWMGSVSRRPNGDFLIEETFLLEQEVHETETELASADIGRLCMALIDSGPDGLEKSNKLRFWGHSHVHMGTSPSGTDERTMDRFGREKMPWYVRGIFNKFGRAEFTIYLFDRGMRINDAAWVVFDPEKNVTVMQDRRRFGSLTNLLEGAGSLLGQPVSLIPKELEAEVELRAAVESEFKAKVKERTPRFFSWGGSKDKKGEAEQNDGPRGVTVESADKIPPIVEAVSKTTPAPAPIESTKKGSKQ